MPTIVDVRISQAPLVAFRVLCVALVCSACSLFVMFSDPQLTGILYFNGSFKGVSTAPPYNTVADDDDASLCVYLNCCV